MTWILQGLALKHVRPEPNEAFCLEPFMAKGLALTSLDIFKAIRLGEWQRIDADFLQLTVEAVTKRLEACTRAKGYHF